MEGFVDLAPGTVFARDFRIVRPLSSGGMGAVYVAEQLSTSKERALKLMRPELVANADQRRRFEQEAKVGARIDSDHVVEVVGAGVDEATGLPWLAMELLAGEDLAQVANRMGPLPAPTVALVFEQLCHALSKAHEQRIVHRDLKLENIFLAKPRRSGTAFTLKVLDFGIAKTLAEAQTKMTAAIGTPLWMAPEQTQAGTSVSPATDVWALGLIAYRLLCGRVYWRSADDPSASTMMILREVLMDPMDPASVRAGALNAPSLPPGFDAWFAKCVARDPRERFPNAGQMYEALAPILAAPGATVAGSPLQSQSLSSGSTHVASQPMHAMSAIPQGETLRSAKDAPTKGIGLWLALGFAAVAVSALVWFLIRLPDKKPPSERADEDEEPSRTAASASTTTERSAAPTQSLAGSGFRIEGPKGVKVFVDGMERGALGLGAVAITDLPRGEHDLRLDGGGLYEDLTKKLHVTDGSVEELAAYKPKVIAGVLTFERKTDGARISIHSESMRPPTTVLGDKELLFEIGCDPRTKKIPLGSCGRDAVTVRATKAGYQDFEQKLVFEDGVAEKRVTIELVEKRETNPDTPPPAPTPSQSQSAPPPPPSGGEFDRGAASASLSSAAGRAKGCKQPGGPAGTGKVVVTFAPSGKVTSATVGAPFAGTPVGACIAAAFRTASVPPFSGSPVSVSKTVTIDGSPSEPPRPPPPPSKGACGCAADDLMCNMKCSSSKKK